MPEPYEDLHTDTLSVVIDPIRSKYYREYMQSVLMAIAEGINVVGTMAWSIFDNFEWNHGSSCRFGIQVSWICLLDALMGLGWCRWYRY